MARGTRNFTAGIFASSLVVGWWLTASAQAAEIQMQVQAAPATPSSPSPTGKLLTIEDAVRIGLDNHPRIKSANERILSQQAVLGQQMAAYYPTISLSNRYSTSLSSSSGGNDHAADLISVLANFNMTLYNFGKREGNVQAARETLGAVQQDYATTTQDTVLSIKQAYYVYLGSQALVKVRLETVRNRELLVRQARGFFEVGTRAKIDVARAEANLYSAQADLIAAENAVKIAWVTLRNAMGSPRLPEQPPATSIPVGWKSCSRSASVRTALLRRTE